MFMMGQHFQVDKHLTDRVSKCNRRICKCKAAIRRMTALSDTIFRSCNFIGKCYQKPL